MKTPKTPKKHKTFIERYLSVRKPTCKKGVFFRDSSKYNRQPKHKKSDDHE